MKLYEFGNQESDTILIQMADDHDLSVIENEVQVIRRLSGPDFRLAALKVENWNYDLSPWKAPAVFGTEGFGGGASDTLAEVLELTGNAGKKYYIGGYSLAGLFALWAVYQTDVFSGAAAASPSMWFPGFTDYMKEQKIQTGCVYLSLGDREEKTGNPVMSTVGKCIRSAYDLLKEQDINCILEWNQGNHFKNADLRTAKAFAWVMSIKRS